MPTEKQDSTAGAAAVPEAGALAEIDFVADWLAVTCPEPANRLRRARRALSSPSGDARPLSAIETAAAKLIEVGQHCTQGFRHACEHCEAWSALEAAVKGGDADAGRVLDRGRDAGVTSAEVTAGAASKSGAAPVAPSIPEEPKAASQKEGGE